jgi:hypothetical protein
MVLRRKMRLKTKVTSLGKTYGGLAILLFFIIFLCSNSANNNYSITSPCFDTIYPVIYNCQAANNGDFAFRTIPAKQLSVKLIPNMETRKKMGLTEINNIIGVHQFFLDHDLVSGFVHPYTKNMFNKLNPGDFVLKYSPGSLKAFTGTISFTHKNKLASSDTLGKNIAFFRQWKLSEMDYTLKNGEVYIKTSTCTFYDRSVCPQSKKVGSLTQIPFWQTGETGYQPLNKFSGFGREDGGTVTIVWDVKNETWFQDIHSSWKEILLKAIEISKTYNTDPAICISDAGPFARKLKANKNFKINVKDLDVISPNGKHFGAGYGYVPKR